MGLKTETQVTPRTTYNWRIRIDGLLAGLVSKVNIPSVEIAEFTHSSGGSNRDIKFPGKKKYGDITLEKVMPHETSDKWAWQLISGMRNDDGTGDVTKRFKCTIEHIADSGDKVIDTWEVQECWVKKIEYSANDAMQEAERMIESVTLSCGFYSRK